MKPTARFFSAVRKLAVTLETETSKLQEAFENRHNNDDDDDEIAAKASRAYHEVNCDVRSLKGQIQGQITQQRAQVSEVSGFIKACREMEQKVSKNVQTLAGHWEKYGYRAPGDAQRATKAKDEESEDEEEAAEEDEAEEGSQEEAGGSRASSPPPPPFKDVMLTPQLSDFGLCEMKMKRALAGMEWCSEAPPMPELHIPHPTLDTPAPPPIMPLTPKRALRMDDDDEELQTPQMSDFGLSDHTMCLNNDFTMELLQRNVEKPQRPPQDVPAPPVMESLHTKVQNLKSPEPPAFYTPGFKLKKTNGPSSSPPPARSNGDPESPQRPAELPTTPEVPVFHSPHMNQLVSSRKSARQVNVHAHDDDDALTSEVPSPRNGAAASKRPWEYDVPHMSFAGVEDRQIPEMPNLESVLGNSLQTRSAKMQKKTLEHKQATKEPAVNSLELDGPTQEFSLGTPRIRMDYQAPSTPEVPDLSSVTQDICKLLTQARVKKTATVHPNVRPENEKKRAVSLSVVSEREFQSLPKYLKRMTLHNLNQVVHNINKFTEERPGEQTELRMEELRRICVVGSKTPIYILCLTELKRLQHLGGASNTSVYKLCSHN